jgi:hypothetical protein
VVISILQLLSAILAVGTKNNIKDEDGQKALAIGMGMGSADTATAIFFSVSTSIMVCALVAHWYLRQMPIYHEVVGHFEARAGDRLEEEEALLLPEDRRAPVTEPSSPIKVLQVSEGYLKISSRP